MTIYVVETWSDYLVQIGFSLSEKKAQKIAKQRTDQSKFNKYFVTKYTINNKEDFCEFE